MKKWYQSKTILASLMTALTVIVGLFAPEISSKLAVESPAIVETVVGVSGVVSAGIAIYGRCVADDDIK